MGGIAGLALIGAAVFFALKLRSSRSGAPSGNPVHYTGADMQFSENSPVMSVSTHRVYVRVSVSRVSFDSQQAVFSGLTGILCART